MLCRLEKFFVDYLEAFSDVDVGPVTIPELETEGEAVNLIIEKFQPRLKKFFKHHSGADGEIDGVEFMQLIKGSNLIDSRLSFAGVLDTFIRANEEEINTFLGEGSDDPGYGGLEEMQMCEEEFQESLLALAYTRIKPKKPFAPVLESFISDLLENGKKRF